MLRFSHLVVVGSLGLFAGLVACSTPDVASADENLEGSHTGPKKPVSESNTDNGKGDGDGDADGDGNKPLDPNASETPSCKDECTAGVRRCSNDNNSGTELCVKASDGCNRWMQGPDCASDATCDRAKNDGTCKAGCVNDTGCSASAVGVRKCSPNQTAELTCTQSGSCFVFKTTRSNIPQECTGSGNFCSNGRKQCVASSSGVCTQHTIVSNPCPSGTVCSGGSCVSTCTNDFGCSASNAFATKCNPEGSRSRLQCLRTTDGCYKWTSATSCSSTETCSSGNCVTSCVSTCSVGQAECLGSKAMRQCEQKAAGCWQWSSSISCAATHICQGASPNGRCGPI
jgi:hypothetical protein